MHKGKDFRQTIKERRRIQKLQILDNLTGNSIYTDVKKGAFGVHQEETEGADY